MYGPYITNGTKNAKIPKDTTPESLTEQECRTLLEQAPDKKPGRGRFARKTATKKPATNTKKRTVKARTKRSR
jgi:DNA topoisomerase I